jgi:hypothetical protein
MSKRSRKERFSFAGVYCIKTNRNCAVKEEKKAEWLFYCIKTPRICAVKAMAFSFLGF